MATKLDDSEILSLLKDGVAAGVKFNDTKLSKERKRVMDYYNGVLPAPVHKGNSALRLDRRVRLRRVGMKSSPFGDVQRPR
jgi:hypothetical protein